MEQLYELTKRLQRLYASNVIMQTMTCNNYKAWRFYVHSKPWKERMKDHSKTLHYILSPNPNPSHSQTLTLAAAKP
jgi:hypothetical protein